MKLQRDYAFECPYFLNEKCNLDKSKCDFYANGKYEGKHPEECEIRKDVVKKNLERRL
jgi:hypothetical protein